MVPKCATNYDVKHFIIMWLNPSFYLFLTIKYNITQTKKIDIQLNINL